MIDRKQMALPAAGGDRDRDLARECVLWKEIEEHFEQPAVCRTVDRCADHYDSGDIQRAAQRDRKSTRLNSSHLVISYAVFCLKKKKQNIHCVSSGCERV